MRGMCTEYTANFIIVDIFRCIENKKYLFYILSKNFCVDREQDEENEEIYRGTYERFGFIVPSEDDVSQQASEHSILVILLSDTEIIETEFYNSKSLKVDCRKEKEKGILIGLTKDQIDKISNFFQNKEYYMGEVTVKFKVNFTHLHKAIDCIPSKVLKRIMPKHSSDFTVYSNPETNASDSKEEHDIYLGRSQLQALKVIQSCNSSKAPVLVVGPFGSGKTRLIARTAYEILQENPESRVLVCAHHQASVHNFEKYYFQHLRKASNSKLICLTPGFRWNEKISSELPNYNLIVATFSTSLYLIEYLSKGHFTHVLLDDGAQACEPETIASLCLANENTKIVIAGDHKQVRKVLQLMKLMHLFHQVGPALLVLGEQSGELKQSLLERLYQIYSSPPLSVFSQSHRSILLRNYRCHSVLQSLPSYLFYESILLPSRDKRNNQWSAHPSAGTMHFICSELNTDVSNVHDSINEKEAMILLREVLNYISKLDEQRNKYNNLCIITASAEQVQYSIISTMHVNVLLTQKNCIQRVVAQNKEKYQQLLNAGRSEDSSQISIEILPSYDIQGKQSM